MESLNLDELDARLVELIRERADFEFQLYDYLIITNVNPFIIPDSFWESVKVEFAGVKDLEDTIGEDICFICTEKHLNFKKVTCCKQKLCNGCCYQWFKESVKCPFCFQDIREF